MISNIKNSCLFVFYSDQASILIGWKLIFFRQWSKHNHNRWSLSGDVTGPFLDSHLIKPIIIIELFGSRNHFSLFNLIIIKLTLSIWNKNSSFDWFCDISDYCVRSSPLLSKYGFFDIVEREIRLRRAKKMNIWEQKKNIWIVCERWESQKPR